VKKISMFDMELADVMQDRLLRRHRLRQNILGNGTFDEDEYAHLIATEVERAQRQHARLLHQRTPLLSRMNDGD
jgi:hypothetical protein